MKSFKRLFSIIVLLALATESYAQTFGVKGGLNIASQYAGDEDARYSDNFVPRFGFHAGPTAEFGINDIFSFETGLILSSKGYKLFDAKISLLYVDIPLTAKATFLLGNIKIFGVFGPYASAALNAKFKAEYFTTNGNGTEERVEELPIGSGENDFVKRFDFGLIAGAGLEFNSITTAVSYGYGLADVNPDDTNCFRTSNRVLSISVGYKFAGLK